MNSLVVLPSEIGAAQQAVLSGTRAAYVRNRHELVPGIVVRGGILGGPRGLITVVNVQPDEIHLRLDCQELPLERLPIELLCGVPRPQTVKKVIHLACTLGLRAVHFVRSELGEKSYLQSSVLKQPEIEQEIIEGLEQACDTLPPEIHIHRSWRGCLRETVAPKMAAGCIGLVADTTSDEAACPRLKDCPSGLMLAIGPEAGWSAVEIGDCKELGFTAVSLGPRMLRTEVAVAVGVGKILG